MQDFETPFSRMRVIVHAIPPVLRPLAIVVFPLVCFHAVFMRTPDVITPVPHAAVTATTPSAPKGPAPNEEEIRNLIEHDDSFLAPKRATCPAVGYDYNLARNPLFQALRASRYLTSSSSAGGTIRIEITPEGRNALGNDLSEDVREITVVVGRKIFSGIRTIDPPPQALAPPLRYATRVDFTWKWSPTNAIGNFVDYLPQNNKLTASAYFLQQPNRLWRVTQIDFHDATPDLEKSP